MKELSIRFNYDKSQNELSSFVENPFDVFVDGVKIDRLKRISLDFKKEPNQMNWDSFRYDIEQYFDWYDYDKT